MSGYTTKPEPDFGEVMTIEEFREGVKFTALMDWDGFGHPMANGLIDESVMVLPSSPKSIPTTATHIIWFNK